jgi:oligopeptide transport system permease protein
MMLRYIVRRILWAIPVLWIVATITFFMARIVPGGPFDAEKNLPPQIMANIKAKYHLDRPLTEQYFLYLGRLAHGDLGVSYKYLNRTVNQIIFQALPVSAELGVMGLLIAIVAGVSLGTIAAVFRGSNIDFAAMFLATAGISLPTFVIGAILIFVVGIWLQLLPVALWESFRHTILPAITLSVSPAAYLARLTRASVLEMIGKDWVRTARSKGLSSTATIFRHVLRNALIPVVTVLGPLIAIIITGSFVVEYLYAIPGMGRFFITAVSNRDYDLILGTSLVFAVIILVANTLVDIAYGLLDPQLRTMLKD